MAIIRNRSELARTPVHRDALAIIEAGLAAVDTSAAVHRSVHMVGSTLTVGDRSWDLTAFRHIHVIGFGKASCAAAQALEEILGTRLTRGMALTNAPGTCSVIELCEATHPLPSVRNSELSEKLVKECEAVAPEDLVLVVVSGGGSAMLCWPAAECVQQERLYHEANRAGITIRELNTVRKHLSGLKGGGLAKLLHPATVIGLIFSDVPGDSPELVASGPTYPDTSSVADAQAIIDRHGLGSYTLHETPKDLSLFEHVVNIVIVSNDVALRAMAQSASELGYAVSTAGDDRYDPPTPLVASLQSLAEPGTAVIAGGESTIVLPEPHGVGGRNQHVALTAAFTLRDGQVFAAMASDGMDNGPHGGAVADETTVSRAAAAGLDAADTLKRCDEDPLFRQLGDFIETGPTGANVSDLYLLVTPKKNPVTE
jgi:glycerate-2-kinase